MTGNELTNLKRQYEHARLNAVRAQMAELEMEIRTSEVINGALYLMQKPLNVVKAMSDNLKRQTQRNGGAEQTPPMGIALDEALASGYAAMNSLRISLPNHAKIEKAPVNINQVIRDVLVISADRLSANGIIVDWHPEPDLQTVYGQEPFFQVLLKILLDNAIIAIGQPGVKDRDVRVDTVPGEEGLIEVCVRDSGPGIDRTLHSKIFEPFFSNWSDASHGVGMGLAIARNILGELGGDIEIYATPRSGCTVCVTLPTCGSQARAQAI